MNYLWEMHFAGGTSETTRLRFRAAGGSPHPCSCRPKDARCAAAGDSEKEQLGDEKRSRSAHFGGGKVGIEVCNLSESKEISTTYSA